VIILLSRPIASSFTWTLRGLLMGSSATICQYEAQTEAPMDSNDGSYLTTAEKTSSMSRLVEQPEEETSWSRLSVQTG
jgi:hypothetical protein